MESTIAVGPVDAQAAAMTEVERLFTSEYRRLVGLARLLVDDPGQAEEVVQDAFVDLHRRWDSLRDPSAAASWLRTAVVNGSRGRLRRRATARRHLSVVEPALADAGPDERAVLAEEHRAVAEALRSLPNRQRACLALRYYDGLTEAQISEVLGISTGSVKTHVHRGMAALATTLEALR